MLFSIIRKVEFTEPFWHEVLSVCECMVFQASKINHVHPPICSYFSWKWSISSNLQYFLSAFSHRIRTKNLRLFSGVFAIAAIFASSVLSASAKRVFGFSGSPRADKKNLFTFITGRWDYGFCDLTNSAWHQWPITESQVQIYRSEMKTSIKIIRKTRYGYEDMERNITEWTLDFFMCFGCSSKFGTAISVAPLEFTIWFSVLHKQNKLLSTLNSYAKKDKERKTESLIVIHQQRMKIKPKTFPSRQQIARKRSVVASDIRRLQFKWIEWASWMVNAFNNKVL